ncbi:MAG: hypothetical protein AAF907_06850 [Planctomycetota bacterium]
MNEPPVIQEAIAPPDPADRPSRLRWRLFPTMGCGLFGGLSLLSGIVGTASLLAQQGGALPDRLIASLIGWALLSGTGGVLWVVAAALCWRGRWAWMAAATVLGFLFFVAASPFAPQ